MKKLKISQMHQRLDQLFGAERTLYLDEVEPTLCDGMNFPGGNGKALGSYSNRYVRYIDLDGNFLEKSYITGKPIGLFMQGQAAILNLIDAIRGEARTLECAFGLCPSALTEVVSRLAQDLKRQGR
ncbi:hypothetical protein ACQZ4R_21745 [Agrobacterium vitis]|uniref:hypothetical protein n=1 Tax=Allorhizobium ampelinum TaxID=3025782 RepID=UPI001F354B3E|nr:hypothetical protein [Allorhizobium ampelinum]